MRALCCVLALASAGCAAPECLFVDQSEDGVAVLVGADGGVTVVRHPGREGTWWCPAGERPPAFSRRSHPPLPPGDVSLDELLRPPAQVEVPR